MRAARPLPTLAFGLLLLSSCSFINQHLFGSERTAPDGGQSAFGAKHTPVLNPGGALYRPDDTPQEMAQSAENPYLTENQSPAGSRAAYEQRRVPGGNEAMIAGTQPAAAAPPPSAMPPPAAVFTPSAAVVAQVPPQAPAPPRPPVPQQAAPANGYPALSATPPTPKRPDAAVTQANIRQMQEEREMADAARSDTMSNPELAAMQKDLANASGAPAPAQPVAAAPASQMAINAPPPAIPPNNPPPAAPAVNPQVAARDTSDGGFSTWLNRVFADDRDNAPAAKPAAQAPVTVSASAPARTQSWRNPDAVAAPASASVPAPVMARKPIATASAAPLEPIHLVPPANMDADETPQAPSAGTLSSGSLAPIRLSPPAETQPQGHYLADNRYAARRAHEESDDGSRHVE